MLALRGWALQVLAGTPAPPPALAATAWRAFLRSEACALALRSALVRSGRVELPPEAAADLADAATADLQRCLAVRAQAGQLGRWAVREEVPLILLKGGRATAAMGPQVGMLDLDVLVPVDRVDEMAAFLDTELGFSGAAPSRGEKRGHHLPQRTAPGALLVEVHRHLKELPDTAALIARSVPLPIAGTRGLAPRDHLLHLLLHGTLSHPSRKGRLRELVLVAAAWTELGAYERKEAERDLAARPAAAALLAQLEMARDLAAGRVPPDGFRREAAARILLPRFYAGVPLPRQLSRAVSNAVCALVADHGERARYWAVAGSDAPSLPRRLWRLTGLSAGMALALPVARAARRAARP